MSVNLDKPLRKNRCPAMETGESEDPTSLEVREEILGTQMDDKRSDGPRLVEGIVDEETTCSERKVEQE